MGATDSPNLAEALSLLKPKKEAPASPRVLAAWIAQAQDRLGHACAGSWRRPPPQQANPPTRNTGPLATGYSAARRERGRAREHLSADRHCCHGGAERADVGQV
ncbi:MAG: hypothetical protein LBK59_11785 [Bifidobacteriaceae bacterium]|jgi:hypothetical protein|nr:hypothetical protein [Bifidobacteriaceae bacterium]